MKFIDLFEQQDYSIWKVNKETLETDVENMEKDLLKITGKTNGGLVPEEIRTSKEYIKTDSMFNKAFKRLQDFNKKSPKDFMKTYSKETRKARMK